MVLPVLDEETRLIGCLEGLSEQGEAVAEVLVVDGGSRDSTPALAAGFAARRVHKRPGTWAFGRASSGRKCTYRPSVTWCDT